MKNVFLLSVSGAAGDGADNLVFEGLARVGAEVLDIGQAAIHDQLALGMLVALPAGDSAALDALVGELSSADIVVGYQSVAADDYQDWVARQGQALHIVTLLARRIGAEQLAAISRAVSEQGLAMAQVKRLTGRVPLEEERDDSRACVELSLRGEVDDEPGLRASLLSVADRLGVDVAFQIDSVYRRNRRLVVFDMDSTLIQAEVIDELAKAAGVGEQVAAITDLAMRGEIDFTESFARRLRLLKGLNVSVLEDIAKSLRLTEGCERLVTTLHKLGFKTAIVSGGFNYFGRYLQRKLGFTYVYANELDVVNGMVTGEVQGTVVDGNRKAELLREIAAKEGLSLEQVIAVGDGANDLPMLGIAGLGVAFRAKPLVKATAKQSITTLGLDGVLYMLGLRDRDIENL